MRFLRLLWSYIRVGVLSELAYRGNFMARLVESVLELGTAMAGLAVIFAYADTPGGWSPDQVLALVGAYSMVGGAIRFLIQPSMERLIESVREGTLDFTLSKPEDAQLLWSIQRVEIWRLTDVVLGFGVLVAALLPLRSHVGAPEVGTSASPPLRAASSSTDSGPSCRAPPSGSSRWRTSCDLPQYVRGRGCSACRVTICSPASVPRSTWARPPP